MRPRSSSPPAPMRRNARVVAVVLMLGGLTMFALLPRVASAAPMHDVDPAADAVASSMAPHAPTEIHVSPNLKRVLQGLICQCGCNLDAYQCQQTMTCNVSTAMWDQAEEVVDRQGKTAEQALELFAADYGERVLAAPTKRGFNLTAWVLPFVALGIGAGVLAFALRGWRAQPLAEDVPSTDVDKRYLDQIERELREED